MAEPAARARPVLHAEPGWGSAIVAAQLAAVSSRKRGADQA